MDSPVKPGYFSGFSSRHGLGACILSLVVVSACAPTVSRRQTDIMEKSGKVAVSGAVLRARVNDLVDRFAARIEQTADRVGGDTQDEAIRRRALVLKVDALPAVYIAGFRADPLAAAVDVWAFAFQFSEYMDSGAGRNAFGSEQPVVQRCARDLIADADSVIRAIASRPEYFDQARARVEGWAKTHPVTFAFTSRQSAAGVLAELRSDNQDVFLAVGAVTDLAENLSERLNDYAAQLPKQARWQAELLMTDVTGAHGLESALQDVHNVGTAAQRATDVLGDVGTASRRATEFMSGSATLLDAERDILTAERRAVLADITEQRAQTLKYLTDERLAMADATRDELRAVIGSLRQERVEALVEVDAIKTRAVDSLLAGGRGLIDYALWRIAILLFGLMLVGATLVVIASRLMASPRR